MQNPLIALTPSGAVYFLAHATSGIVVARVTAEGAFDTSFGSGGRAGVGAPFTLRAGVVRSDANGALVMGGSSGPLATEAPFVARLTNTGQLDSSFGDNGIVVVPFLQGRRWLSQLAIAADGKILAAGERFYANPVPYHVVARLNTNGTIDAGFGSGGRIVVAGGIQSMLLEPDGKLLLGGTINELRSGLAWLARYNTDGSPDVTFGQRGRSRADFSLGASYIPGEFAHIQRDSDGGYRAVAGLLDWNAFSFTAHFALARFVASGSNPGVIGLRSSGFTARIDFVNTALSVNESATSVTLQVGRSGNTAFASSVDYIAVTLTPDAVDEADESFTVQLRNVSSGTELGTASASVSIVDDDTGSNPPGSGGGGEESLITLLLWTALVRMRRAVRKGRR